MSIKKYKPKTHNNNYLHLQLHAEMEVPIENPLVMIVATSKLNIHILPL